MSAANNSTGKSESTSHQSSNRRQINSRPTNNGQGTNRNSPATSNEIGDSFLSDHLESHDHRAGTSQPMQHPKQNSNASRNNTGQASVNNSRSCQNSRNKKSDSQMERSQLNDQENPSRKSKKTNQK